MDLPIDVILEIFDWLAVADVVTLRSTCKLFYDISQSRSIWLALYNRQASQACYAPVLEQPLSSTGTARLQAIILRRHRLEQNWTSPNPKALLKAVIPSITLDMPHSIPLHFELLPGGRWLLGMSQLSSFTLWDLDEPTPLGVIVTPQPKGYRLTCSPAICVNAEVDPIAVDLALSLQLANPDGDTRDLQTRVKIWRIALVPGRETEDSLPGREISDFTLQGHVLCASLRGNLYACVMRNAHVWQSQFETLILQWADGFPVSQLLRIVVDNPEPMPVPFAFRLISQSQLLIVTYSRATLFDLWEAAATDDQARTAPVWTYMFAEMLPEHSGTSKPDPYTQNNGRLGTWLSMYAGRNIYRLFLSNCSSMSQGYHMSATQPSCFQSLGGVGHRWALWSPDVRCRGTYTLYKFPPTAALQGLEPGSARSVERTIQLDPRTEGLQSSGPMAFDEESGRLCLYVDPFSLGSMKMPVFNMPYYSTWVVHVIDFT